MTMEQQGAKIIVIGVGGAGNNLINHMIDEHVAGVDYVSVNTDQQALDLSLAEVKIKIGKKGLGAGANPEIGRRAAEESLEEIKKYVEGYEMAFITAGMGGGTGTGAAPVIAGMCRELGLLTVGVVTKPFSWEGKRRMDQAELGQAEFQKNTDAIITIPNNRLREYLKTQGKKLVLKEAFKEVDNVLRFAVQGICDLIQIPGLINLDFEDVKTILQSGGSSLMGVGSAEGEDRAKKATLAAMHNPLLEHGIDNAHGVIFNVTGGSDFTFEDLDEASEIIHEHVSPEANIIVGAVIKDDVPEGTIQVTVVATGFEAIDLSLTESSQKNQFDILRQSETRQEHRPVKQVSDLTDDGIPSFLLGKRDRR